MNKVRLVLAILALGSAGFSTLAGQPTQAAGQQQKPAVQRSQEAKTCWPSSCACDFKKSIAIAPKVTVYVRSFIYDMGNMEFRLVGTGSGMVKTSDGYIITNEHVVRGADKIDVYVKQRFIPARVIGRDWANDIALIKVDLPRELGTLTPAPISLIPPKAGDWILKSGFTGVIRTSEKENGSLARGIISNVQTHIQRSVTDGTLDEMGRLNVYGWDSPAVAVATDAQLAGGDSGGPSFNCRGEVVGIDEAMAYATSIGYYIPIATVERILPRLLKGDIQASWLGLFPQSFIDMRKVDRDGYLKSRLQKKFYYNGTAFPNAKKGILISQPPEKLKSRLTLRAGDVIMRMDGKTPRDAEELNRWITAIKPGDEIIFEMLRDDTPCLIRLTAEKFAYRPLTAREESELMGSSSERRPPF
jgi:serine protease Do